MKTNYIKNATILVIDDNPTNLDILCNCLTNIGAKVLLKKDGEGGIETAIRKQPDIILLDILMPTVDGYETCRRLKSNPITQSIPIIFTSALTETVDKVKGFALGAVDYITKPIQVEEVLSRIETHLDLCASKQLIERKNKKQKELIHILCHDLLNSVGQIHSLLKIKELKVDSLSKYDVLIEKSTHNALEIIELVRTLSSLEEGKLTVNLITENLSELITQAVAMVEDKLTSKNIQVIQQINDTIYVNVEKVSFINSVIINLLTNAIKFSFSNSKIIIIAEKMTSHILLSVEDFGIGMPKEIGDNIFEINKPTTRPGTNREMGTGFGMPLVKEFMLAYNGMIEVVSQEKTDFNESHGTKVNLILPNVLE